ncbi:maleylpyruvate isomerase family mycothiol-dependent enzyme [Streptomyces sp. NPDC050504]|uniref:maleylpyruvate isomerase family mycothiol-dependent enzyme n=1 Tax=Streptomyces sp. NPDC050504 TaxID=3365618 RepID=UPI00379118FC
MKSEEFIEILDVEGRRLAAAAERAAADAPVPACPDWVVHDLVGHVGRVHRWATRQVAGNLQERQPPVDPPDLAHEALLEWYRQGHRTLIETLRSAPADLSCWTLFPGPDGSSRAFWRRRQAHETAVHRVDAESAAGLPLSQLDPAFAADGVDELLCGVHPLDRGRVRSETPRTLRLRATDVPDAAWTVRLSADAPTTDRTTEEPEAPDCVVEGPAADLYLVLWNRLPQERLSVTGDAEAARLWREASSI